jgi:hypothetical protein
LKILKYIWNLFFCSPEKKSDTVVDLESKNEDLSPYTNCLSDDISAKDSVILNENNPIPDADYFFNSHKLIENENNPIPDADYFFNSHKLIENENKTDKDFLNSVNKPKNKKRTNVIGLKTKQEIKEYFLEFGSLDTLTCQQKFNVKSLRNFIWALRKDGFVFKTKRIFLDNEKGEKIEVTNYKIMCIKKNGTD